MGAGVGGQSGKRTDERGRADVFQVVRMRSELKRAGRLAIQGTGTTARGRSWRCDVQRCSPPRNFLLSNRVSVETSTSMEYGVLYFVFCILFLFWTVRGRSRIVFCFGSLYFVVVFCFSLYCFSLYCFLLYSVFCILYFVFICICICIFLFLALSFVFFPFFYPLNPGKS